MDDNNNDLTMSHCHQNIQVLVLRMLPEMQKMVASGVRKIAKICSHASLLFQDCHQQRKDLLSLIDLKVKGENANHHYLTSCLVMTASDLSDQVMMGLHYLMSLICCI